MGEPVSQMLNFVLFVEILSRRPSLSDETKVIVSKSSPVLTLSEIVVWLLQTAFFLCQSLI